MTNGVSSADTSPGPLKGPGDFPDSPLSRILQQPLMLGLFLPIQNGGWTPSRRAARTDWTFDYNARLACAPRSSASISPSGWRNGAPKVAMAARRSTANIPSTRCW